MCPCSTPLVTRKSTHSLSSLSVAHSTRVSSSFSLTGDTLFIIRSGQVKVSLIHEDGREFILSLMGEGEVFGELSLIDDQPRSANVVALEKTDLLMLRRADFLELVEGIPQIAVALLEELASRLRRTDEQVGGLALLTVHNRVAKTILRLASDRGVETDDGILIEQRPTHQQLANMAGTTRETVTRALGQLESDGYIVCKGRQILVLPDDSEEEGAAPDDEGDADES